MTGKRDPFKRLSQSSVALSECMARLDEIDRAITPKTTIKTKRKAIGVKHGQRRQRK